MKRLKDGEQVRIHIPNDKSQGIVKHECCNCKLEHDIFIGRIGKDVTIAFVRTAKEMTKATRKQQ